jgi:hypothetical protein
MSEEYRERILRYSCESGDPLSGLLFVLEPRITPPALHALHLSLQRLQLTHACLTRDLSLEGLLRLDPRILVALGPEAAEKIDELQYPLALQPFADATEAKWFPWTRGASGLLLPPLTPALDSEEAKRRFWKALLNLTALLQR